MELYLLDESGYDDFDEMHGTNVSLFSPYYHKPNIPVSIKYPPNRISHCVPLEEEDPYYGVWEDLSVVY